MFTKKHKPMEDTSLLTTAYSRVESEMIRDLLKNAGIPTLVRPKYGMDPLPVLAGSSALGEEIYVPDDKLDEARDLVEGFMNADYAPEDAPDDGDQPDANPTEE